MVSDPQALFPHLCLTPCFNSFELLASPCESPLPGVMFFPKGAWSVCILWGCGWGTVQGLGGLGWQEGGKAIQAEGPAKG